MLETVIYLKQFTLERIIKRMKLRGKAKEDEIRIHAYFENWVADYDDEINGAKLSLEIQCFYLYQVVIEF